MALVEFDVTAVNAGAHGAFLCVDMKGLSSDEMNTAFDLFRQTFSQDSKPLHRQYSLQMDYDTETQPKNRARHRFRAFLRTGDEVRQWLQAVIKAGIAVNSPSSVLVDISAAAREAKEMSGDLRRG